VSPAKTAEPIEMPFGLRTRVGSGNHVLDGSPDPPWEAAILRWKGASHYMFGLWVRMGPRNRVRCHFRFPDGKGQFLGKGSPIVKYRDFLP